MFCNISFRNTNENYTALNNACLDDERLGATTLGILSIIMRNKPDWVVYPQEIAKRAQLSRKTVDKHFALLEEFGYMFVIKENLGRGKGGKYHRFFSDVPMTDFFKDYIRQRFESELRS